MKKGLRLRWRWGLAVALGACWPLAFAPFDLSFLAIVLLLALFWLSDAVTPSAAATMGFAFGFGAFATGIYWLAIPLHNFAHMSWLLSAGAVALLALYCAIYPALSLWVAAKWWAHSRLFALPFLWIGAEWLQAHLFTGFPLACHRIQSDLESPGGVGSAPGPIRRGPGNCRRGCFDSFPYPPSG